MRYLTFALAKGRLADKSLQMFNQIGITCREMEDKTSRKLIFTNEELGSNSSDSPKKYDEILEAHH